MFLRKLGELMENGEVFRMLRGGFLLRVFCFCHHLVKCAVFHFLRRTEFIF